MAKLGGDSYLRTLSLWRDRVPSFDVYPFALPAVRNLKEIEFHPRVTFLVGENGSGKSTLLEAIAVALDLNAEGGSRNHNFRTKATHSPLHEALRLVRGTQMPGDAFFLRAESFYNVATEIDRLEDDDPGALRVYGGRSLHEQSHGESFLSLFQHRLHGLGLYLMDEPEAALSPSRQLSFLTLLDDLVQRRSQFVIATHSPILLAYPDAWIYVLGDDGPRRTPYEETEHYRVTRMFLENPARMLRTLLEDD